MLDGTMIKTARTSRGWSQTQLISAMRTRAVQRGLKLVSPESLRVSLSRWENGRHEPDELYTELLCDVLELPAVGPSADNNLVVEPVDDTLRGLLAQYTDRLRALDRRFGSGAVRCHTAAHVASLEAQWRTSSGRDQLTIARVQADAAALAAWQDLDAGDTAMAARHYALAKAAASRSEDTVLLAHTMGEQAIMLAETGRALIALEQAKAAEDLPGLPNLLRSWLAASRAQVAACCPGESSTARRSLRRAESLLNHARAGEGDELPFIFHSRVHLTRWTGHILARTKDPAASRFSWAALRSLPDDFVRARCGQHLDLAEDAVNGGRFDEAEALLASAAPQIVDIDSARLRHRHELLSGRVRRLPTAV